MRCQLPQPCLVVVLLVGLVARSPIFGADHPAELLPRSTVIYAEISDPPALLEYVWEHPLTAHVQTLKPHQEALDTPQFRQFWFGLRFVEAQLGMGWQEAFRTVTQDGVVLAFDARTQGVALLAKAGDENKLNQIKQTFVDLARQDADNKGKNDPYEERDYRGITVYRTKEGGFATHGPWLVLVNKTDLGRDILDGLIDSREQSLANNEQFQQAREVVEGMPLLWMYANVGAVRESGAAPQAFSGKADNPVGELLLGGVLEVLQHTPYATAELRGDDRQLGLQVAMPQQRSWITEEREYFFGSEGAGQAPPVCDVPDQLFTLTAHRDVAEMWLRAGDLFDEKVNDQFAQAEGTLSTLFGGKDFAEDVLGALSPRLQLVATRQEFPADRPEPAIKLPAFALVAEMKEPEESSREFRRLFQNLIGFLNVVGAMNGQPQLELDFESLDAGELVTSTFVPEADGLAGGPVRIHENFSPSIAFAEERMVISSTAGLAREIASATTAASRESGDVVNLSAGLSAGLLQTVLADNLTHLVSKNMLKEGNTREEAESQTKLLLEALALLEDVGLTLSTNDQSLKFDLTIGFAEQSDSQQK